MTRTLRPGIRWLPFILCGAALGLLAAVALLDRIPPIYQATVTVLVTPGTANATGATDLTSAEQLARTYAEAVRTRPILEQAAARIGLQPRTRDLQQAVTARSVSNTQLLRLVVEDADPTRAASLANAVIEVFTESNSQAQAARFASVRQNLEQVLTAVRADIDARAAALAELNAQPQSPERDASLTRLQGEMVQLQASYADTARNNQVLSVAEAQRSDVLTVIEPAAPPADAVWPNRLLILTLLVLGGSALGLVTAAARDYLDDRVRNRQRLSVDSGLRVLGEIPRWSTRGPSSGTSSTLLPYLAGQETGQHSRRAAESYRLLMNSLGVTTAQARPSSIMVASARAGEGKTTTAANLAMVLAAAGRRVILVDANLYRPALTRWFSVGNRTGLSTLLLNPQEPLDLVLKHTAQPGLRVLTSGPAPADPSALLSSDRLDARLAELVAASDVVVIDTPPLLAQPDAALLAARVDAVLLVAEPTSRLSEVRRAVDILAEAGATLVGSTLNRARLSGLKYTAQAYETGPGGPGGSASQTASTVDVSRAQEQA